MDLASQIRLKRETAAHARQVADIMSGDDRDRALAFARGLEVSVEALERLAAFKALRKVWLCAMGPDTVGHEDQQQAQQQEWKADGCSLRSSTYLGERAEEARAMADWMSDGYARNMMREIAWMYDSLGKRAAKPSAIGDRLPEPRTLRQTG